MDPLVQEYLYGKRLLVTGASGYLAGNLIDFLKNIPCSLKRLSREPALPVLNGKASVEDIQGNISDVSVWNQALKETDIVFHFAGQTSIYVADKDPESDYIVNVLPILHIMEVCKKI